MLVLMRRVDEQVVIGDGEVVLTVVEIKGGHVVIGVEAPPGVTVRRAEVQDRIDRGRGPDVNIFRESARVEALKAEIARLRAENAELRPARDGGSPRPWTFGLVWSFDDDGKGREGPSYGVVAADGVTVATAWGHTVGRREAELNAARIVRAVNAGGGPP